MYLAELLMTAGTVMVAMHLTVVIGICVVIVLQVVRIFAEEQLLTRHDASLRNLYEGLPLPPDSVRLVGPRRSVDDGQRPSTRVFA